MTDDPTADAVDVLLGDCVRSVEELDILLAMRAEATRRWTSRQLAERLHLDFSHADAALQNLLSGGAIRNVGADPVTYLYAPGTTPLRAAIDALAEAHATDRVALILRMSAKAMNRARSQTREIFAQVIRARSKRNGE